MDGVDGACKRSVVFAQLIADERLVEVDVAVHIGGQEQLARAVGGRRDTSSDAWTDGSYSVTVDDDVGDVAVRQKGVPQSPHGRLP